MSWALYRGLMYALVVSILLSWWVSSTINFIISAITFIVVVKEVN